MSEVFVEAIDRSSIASRVAELGRQLAEDYDAREPVLVAVLHGALPFVADLVRHLSPMVEVDFLALSRFGQGGRVRIAMDTAVPLDGRHVILVEDIVDTGLTLAYVRRLLEARQVESLRTAALVDKAPRRIVDVPLEYRGFEVGDEFLLGYGLDWEGKYRNLSSIWAVLDLAAFQRDPGALARRVFNGSSDNLGP
ncbi:MAG: hypoxanthine phosphoribosyltransferase [Actinomycetota bacterium]|nr:hypoxanthine phosphoribosyltransferase [Actinomycetota bacterium]